MAHDDTKTHHGRAYTGMTVGHAHDWIYPSGRWLETKIAPDQWDFTFRSQKQRRRAAPADSGAPRGTMFHWLVLAQQRVRKVDANTYETFMEGQKWKLAHRRPAWRRWSSEYREQESARDKMIAVLEETLARLKADRDAGASRIESQLDPAVFGPPNRRIEEWQAPTRDELADAQE